MSVESELMERSGSKCELCGSGDQLKPYEVAPATHVGTDTQVLLCVKCNDQVTGDTLDAKHWFCLKDSMWSQVPAVQVIAFRLLTRLTSTGESWTQDLLDQLYLDDETKGWAEAGLPSSDNADQVVIKDSNGAVLSQGDTVTLIKDLVVKGANFTAKRGTTVKNISLTDDEKLVEGRVNGTHIVLVAAYLKKA